VACIHLAQDTEQTGCCEHSSESLGSVKYGEFLVTG